MHSLSIMGLNYYNKYSKVSRAAMRIRTMVALKGGWQDLSEAELARVSVDEKDPEVIHVVKEILGIVVSPLYRSSIRDNEIHYRLFHRLPWDVRYGPEKCPLCGCEINDLGYCCCGGAD